jgi:hypothetical protein
LEDTVEEYEGSETAEIAKELLRLWPDWNEGRGTAERAAQVGRSTGTHQETVEQQDEEPVPLPKELTERENKEALGREMQREKSSQITQGHCSARAAVTRNKATL